MPSTSVTRVIPPRGPEVSRITLDTAPGHRRLTGFRVSSPDQLKSKYTEGIVQFSSPLSICDLHDDGLARRNLSMVLEDQVKLTIRIELCISGGLISVDVADLGVDNLEATFLNRLAHDREIPRR
jgi:hypothetical protein